MTKEQKIKDLKDIQVAMDKFYEASIELTRLWGSNPEILDNGYYPFKSSFDELVCDISEWKEEAEAQITNKVN